MALVKTVEMRILANAGNAQQKLDELSARADKLDGDDIRLRFRVDSANARAQLDEMRAKAMEAGFRDVSIKVKVDGAGRAIADLRAVKAEEDAVRLRTLGGGGPALLGPALLAAPAIATLAGGAAGAAAGLAGAFAAGAAALAAFGAVAKPVLSDAKTAAGAVQKAQENYNAAIAAGAGHATAYKAEQKAIAKAYAGMSPAQVALSKQLGDMSKAWQDLKSAQTPVVAGALQPWLRSITDLTKNLAPVIAHVAPVIRDLGAQFDKLIGSTAFRGFRDFIASTGTAAVSAGGQALTGFIKGIMELLPKFDPLIREAISGVTRLGTAFANWAGSKKASDDITKFMQWFSTNGPAISGLLKNIGGALKNIAPGLAAGGVGELNALSAFFGVIAKLPPGLAKPLGELAAVLLVLNKLGVINVGLKLTGMDAAALAAKGGAAGLWGKLLPGVRMVGGVATAVLAVDFVLKNTSSGKNKNWFDNPFGMPGPKDKGSANNWLTSWSPYERFFSRLKSGAALAAHDVVAQFSGIGHAIAGSFDQSRHAAASLGHFIAGSFDQTRHAAASAAHSIASAFDNVRHSIAAKFDGVRSAVAAKFAGAAGWLKGVAHSIASAFDNVRHDIAAKFDGIKGAVVSKFSGAGAWLVSAGKAIIQGLISGIESMASAVGSAIGRIASTIRSFLPFSPAKQGPLSGTGSPDIAGAKIAQMLAGGMDAGSGAVARSAARLAGAAGITPATAGAGYGGGAHYEIHLHGVIDKQGAAREIHQLMREYKRHGGGAALGIA